MNPPTPATAEKPAAPAVKRAATMKAIVKTRPGPGAEVREVPVPTCGPRELLLRVRRAGVCGTDLHIVEWDRWSQGRLKPPVTLGHEFVGDVIERGGQVTEFDVGDRVSCESHIVCQHCIACRTGNAHVCENTRILGVDVNGGFAEFVAVPAVNAWRAPANIPIEVAAVMEPLGNAVHTAFAGPLSGCNVAVTGCGPIGLFAIGVARAAGAARVFASDVSPYRLELARTMNADTVIDVSRENFVERVKQLTNGLGLDGVLEMSGNPQAVRDGLAALRNGGRLSLLGLPKESFELDWNRLVIFKGVTIHGIIGRRMYETWYQMDNLLGSGRLDIRPAITHVMPMEAFDDAIDLLRSGKAGKVVLVPWGESA
ncbi:MAG: L-threonine 3-dehydrogenase [Candidatus Eisenbacteria bacterium]|uniref:L-threonine 3-dehydrogenase n=1 Tax=Eiseniibacteriota bacterium TaxID=2212470 RepID=A0A9D6LAN5_UNCEI|nr:L-threonine 3-dehydrogenase [Candidatus Eisenbacteria bacterium]MBI3539703.1 L-threonine 3-dehydrogenase [Candidatus Eisenbacteria bacterium]